MRIHWLLKDPKKKEGMTSIYFTVRYFGQVVILYPRESINTINWTNKGATNRPKQIADNAPLIGRLTKFESLIRDTYDELLKDFKSIIPGEVLKQAVYAQKFPTEVKGEVKETYVPILITDLFQTMIDDSKSRKRLGQDGKAITPQTIDTYKYTQTHLAKFQEKQRKRYNLRDIDQKLVDGFSDYLSTDLNMAFNGAGKHMKNLRTLINYGRQKKLITTDVLLDIKIRVTQETPDNIYLTEKDIEDLMKIENFDSPLYEVVRDLFVIGCKTGLRFSDYSSLTMQKINNGFIHITQQKTQGRITIPIHPIVAEIIAKYSTGLPTCPPNQVFNKYLKEIGKKLPQLNADFEKVLTRSGKPDSKTYKKYNLLQSHTARRSFCTNEYLNGTPTITIMAISGHKSEKSFMAYIKADSFQHAILMRDGWKKRGKDSDRDVEGVAA